jgi:hypothetical protein
LADISCCLLSTSLAGRTVHKGAGEIDTYRNLEPKSMLEETKHLIEAPWNKKVKEGLGTRPASLQKSYEMKPETPVATPAL